MAGLNMEGNFDPFSSLLKPEKSLLDEWHAMLRRQMKIEEEWLLKVLPEVMPKEDLDAALKHMDSGPFLYHGVKVLRMEYSEFPYNGVTVLKDGEAKFSKLFPRSVWPAA